MFSNVKLQRNKQRINIGLYGCPSHASGALSTTVPRLGCLLQSRSSLEGFANGWGCQCGFGRFKNIINVGGSIRPHLLRCVFAAITLLPLPPVEKKVSRIGIIQNNPHCHWSNVLYLVAHIRHPAPSTISARHLSDAFQIAEVASLSCFNMAPEIRAYRLLTSHHTVELRLQIAW